MDYKLKVEKKKYARIEDAFKKISAAVPITGVQDVLSRFLLKEERLTEVMNSLNKNREKSENYMKTNNLIQSKINELLLTQTSSLEITPNVLKNKIHALIIKIGAAKERHQKMVLILNTIKLWASKRLAVVFKDKDFSQLNAKELYEALYKGIKLKIREFQKSPFITEL